MFSYVAKSLLSKTLKTFLRKYLENIEFESISYGSNGSNSDATGSVSSGWDVRLSNVKLREGMELIKLPGTRRRKVVIKKRVKRRKKKKVKSRVEHEAKQKQPSQMNNGTVRPGRVRRCTSQGNITFPIPGVAKPIQFANQHPVQPKQEADQKCRNGSMSSGSEFDYFSSAPSTPVQQHTVLCTPLGLCSSSRHTKNVKIDNAQDLTQIPTLPFDDDEDGDNIANVMAQREKDAEKDEFDPIKLGPNIQTTSESIFRNNLHAQNADEDSDSEASADSIIEVEEEQIIEDTMSLVVGAGGAIGTLNIRLVGKELHVTVEDAHLVIEAMSMEELEKPSDEKLDAANREAKGHLRADSTISETSIDAAQDAPPAASDDSMTFGERIKKKSMFARFLSMIPHLFLRDCRVSIILPGDSDFCDEESAACSVGDCTVFECGIDFLSVTSGDDFMDVLRLDTPTESPLPSQSNNAKEQNHNTSNVFSRKRIMTGKGPEGGLWVKIHPPNGLKAQSKVLHDQRLWARQKFLNTSGGYFFRCSGLDLHARMLIEVNDDVGEEIAAAWSSEYDDYTMDSMLFGVDYVDPISLTRHQIREQIKREMIDNPEKYDAAKKARTDTDANGIQQIPFQSNFHWLDQQTHRKQCPTAYMPLHECDQCWNACVSSNSTAKKSKMDSKMPLPGFVFCLSVTDAIEVNVDRNSIDAIAYAISLMTSDDESMDVKKLEADKQTPRVAPSNTRSAEEKVSESFPGYMQPDATYLSGIHLSKVMVRVHAMHTQSRNDLGLQFRYWQLVMQSLFLEDQQIISDEMSMRDITCHVGKIECTDFAGVCERQMLVAGSEHKFDLPFTASQILDVSLPTIPDTYAIHGRLVMCSTHHVNQSGDDKSSSTGVVDINAGVFKVDVNKSLPSEITASANVAMLTLFPKYKMKTTKDVTKQGKKNQPNASQQTSNWMFQVSTHDGNVKCYPIVELKIPETQFRGSSGRDGLSFDTFVHGLGVQFGSPKTPLRKFPLCSLPEILRMHILVFLDDLSPLENVLQISFKKNVSVFLHSHTINKKLSAIHDAQKKVTPMLQRVCDRRKKLLKQLHELNDDALEQLLAAQCRINGTD